MFALSLTLANEIRWLVVPEGERALFFVKQLAEIMQLKIVNIADSHKGVKPVESLATNFRTSEGIDDSKFTSPTNQLIISTDGVGTEARPKGRRLDVGSTHMKGNGKSSPKELQIVQSPPLLPTEGVNTVRYHLRLSDNKDLLAIHLQQLSFFFSLESERGSGLLIHGALAELHGLGVILAGHGGVGKTTAAGRLPWPWRSLCDDTTLVVKDSRGDYWAHPWPTWSTFLFGGNGGSWDVQNAVPLTGIFFLSQASGEWVEPLTPVGAACLLNDSAEQVSMIALRHMSSAEVRKHRLRRLDSIVSLAKSIPVFRLFLSTNGAFWCEIEKVLDRKLEVIS